MSVHKQLKLYVISDSVGGTGTALGQAALAQFPHIKSDIENHSFIKNTQQLEAVLSRALKDNAFILHTLVDNTLNQFADEFCEEFGLPCFDLLSPIIKEIMNHTGESPSEEVGALHTLDKNYFDRISSIEFAVKYDDGKDPKGFIDADILLLGISRTSKTPLSIFLANRNYKVANLPLLPEATLPEELWEVDRNKIVGLTNDRDMLSSIRRERMISYGMNPDTVYSSLDRIDREIEYAERIYEKLGCLVINVSNKSIEETSTIILKNLPIKKK